MYGIDEFLKLYQSKSLKRTDYFKNSLISLILILGK